MIDWTVIAVLIREARVRLGLEDWTIGYSTATPDESDKRSTVDIDRNLHVAIIRIDPACPAGQWRRQIFHEVLHVRLAELEDVFRLLVLADETASTWWHRSEERAIEALVNALVDTPRHDYRGGPAWTSAVYPERES